jgi:aryl-alcohol dehydrogenase-like predicted oxidoreductase
MKNPTTFTFGSQTVQRLGYGAMKITGPGVWGYPSDHDGALAVLRRAVELGVDFVDTADAYGPYVSEELIFEALHPYGAVKIATKAGLVRTGPNVWATCGVPDYLRQECEMSLRRLGQESLDLFQLHRIDQRIDRDEQFGLLRALLDEGKVKAIGLSNVNVEEIQAARKIVPVVTVQNRFNLTDRTSEPVLEYCESEGIGFIPWHPVDSGQLARPGGPLDSLATQHGISVAQLSLAWLLQRSPVMVPIPGTTSVAHLEENWAARALEIDKATLDAVEAAAR